MFQPPKLLKRSLHVATGLCIVLQTYKSILPGKNPAQHNSQKLLLGDRA